MKLVLAALIGWTVSIASITAQAQMPPDFDAAKWQQITAETLAKGSLMQTPYNYYKTLSYLNPADLSKAHTADYFSAVGNFDNQQKFVVDHFEIVSETWTIDAQKNWNIDQWIFVVSVDGSLTNGDHNFIVEDAGGRVLVVKTISSTPDERLQGWSERLSEWENRTLGVATPFDGR